MKLDSGTAAKVPASIRPNQQQEAILEAAPKTRKMVIEALAGTGKTSTLKMLGKARPYTKMLYIAYNKSIQIEAEASFPANVKCKTHHAMAYAPMQMFQEPFKSRLNGRRITAREVARILGIQGVQIEDATLGSVWLDSWKVAQLANEGVVRFMASADLEILPSHVPWVPGLVSPDAREQLKDALLPLMVASWEETIRPNGRLKFTHDHYLKLFQMRSPRLPYDVILLDEAQDVTPCVASIATSQSHAQIVLVGDSNQAIYEWRGAKDALKVFPAQVRLPLTQSYRFGQELADEANKWLKLLESANMVQGWEERSTAIDEDKPETAIICRTNAQVIAELMDQQASGKQVALVSSGTQDPKGTNAIESMARAAGDLQAGRSTTHPELLAFTNWVEVQQYVKEDPAGSDLGPFVQMVDKYGPQRILAATSLVVPENQAEMVISTAHKSKGREWDSVRIAPDFGKKAEAGGGFPDHEMKLAYVAVTRAKYALQRGSLAVVDEL